MNLAAALFCAVTTALSVQAITVSVDRADVRPVTVPSEPSQSVYVNGWRPLTGSSSSSSSRYENFGVDRSLAPLHPVLGKLQEHLQAASEQPKPQRRNKPASHQYQAVIEYSPGGVPTGFVFTSKPRSEDPKSLSTDREYAFLVPPPREMLRFELEPLKKPPLSEPYVRSSQFIPQAIKPADPRSPTYYIKPSSFGAPVHPFSQARPFVEQYNVAQPQQQQQTAFQTLPNKNPAKQFDSLKSSNDKHYYQNSGLEASAGKLSSQQQQQHYERFPSPHQHPAAQQQHPQQQQQQHQQVINGNYYNQISHPGHYKQPSYERDPSFLVHESHEISYVTPSYKYRPATYHFESPTQEVYSTSTQPPSTRPESTKYTQAPASVTRPDTYKQYQSTSTIKDIEKQRHQQHQQVHHNPSNSFYIHDFQKTRYTPDINEVLPKINQPVKFSQLGTTQAPYLIDHTPHKVVYVRPELQQQQQQQQYPGSIIPISINQRPADVEYETPESISLKHFNEQQFLLQQQLIQQDRLRLREQEKRRQQELLRQQQEELHKRQQEIKLLELKQKEKQRLEQQLQTVQPDIVKELPVPTKPTYSQPFNEPEPQKITPKEQYKYTHQPIIEHEVSQATSETPFQPIKEDIAYQQVTVQKFEEVVTPTVSQAPTTQEDFQPVVRPYRPQKPLREQIRRRKPSSTPSYEATLATETPTAYSPEASAELTDVPIQTTAQPEISTSPLPSERPFRSRRPGGPLRRRRPSSTTSTTDSSASQEYDDDVVKYNTQEIQEFEKKKKRVRPVSGGYDSAERRPIRKRPVQRAKGYGKEHFENLSERIKTADDSLKDISPTENYPAPFLKELYGTGYSSSTEKTLSVDVPQEVSTEKIPVEFYAETTVASSSEYYEPTNEDREEEYTHKLEDNTAEDHLFTKTEVNHVETTSAQSSSSLTTQASTPSPTTTTTTTTTTSSPSTTTTSDTPSPSKAILSSPKATHRIRPSRYGNATRPRFSIKDYKSRMEYKNRLAQSSASPTTTETSSSATSGPKRGYKNHQPADPNFKEAVNRYKHMSRATYRGSSSSAAPTAATSQQTTEEQPGSTDRLPSRYTPKKRINASHYYRSRVAGGSSTTPASSDQPHSTARPENVFSSAIRKRPTLKSKLHPLHNKAGSGAATATESTEMQSAAETGSFASTSTTTSDAEAVTSPSASEAANELAASSPVADDSHDEPSAKPSSTEAPSAPLDLSDVTMDEGEEQPGLEERPKEEAPAEESPTNSSPTAAATAAGEATGTQAAFDLRREEELFARASQSVADLTSSASALYDKPGMFKAVSPASENRLISAHLKIATDEPTLPIEAFFQDFSKKN